MPHRWKPNVTVAAVIEREGRFLLVEESTATGLRLNNPAGHLDPGESILDACAREVMEETAWRFTPRTLVGIYLHRVAREAATTTGAATTTAPGATASPPPETTYLRFTFAGELGTHDSARRLDHGIVRTVWMTADEIRASTARHRSPMLLRSTEDYLDGARFPIEMLHTILPVGRRTG